MVMLYRPEVSHMLGEFLVGLLISLSQYLLDRYILIELVAVALLYTAPITGGSNKVDVSQWDFFTFFVYQRNSISVLRPWRNVIEPLKTPIG